RGCDCDSGGFECGNFGSRGASAATDNRASVAHAASGRRGRASNETGDRFFAVFLDPFSGFFFSRAADFANHDDALGLGVGAEHFDHLEMGGAIYWIAANPDAGGLADPAASKLPDSFVSQRAAAGHDSDFSFFVNVAGRDANAATPVRIFTFARR